MPKNGGKTHSHLRREKKESVKERQAKVFLMDCRAFIQRILSRVRERESKLELHYIAHIKFDPFYFNLIQMEMH